MTAPPIEDATEVAGLLADWIPAQRWFAGKGRAVRFAARPLTRQTEGGREVQLWLADAHYGDGESETYQVPILLRDEPSESLRHVLIGHLGGEGRPARFLYDALHDKSVTQGWLEDIRAGAARDGVQFIAVARPEAIPANQPSLVLSAEQSNTSLVFGNAVILKVFRRLAHGENPDIEVHRALSAFPEAHVAPLLGYVQLARAGEAVISLAMLQQFLPTATDGWELAKISVRDLMGEADLHAAEAGGDFAGEAHRLGAAVAAVHADLRRAFGTVVLDAPALGRMAEQMTQRLEQALA
ncbi:MAG: aminoglycoside phosphotransferase, partial [Frankiaceae bacterium]|nr:aminoglycoside phosphotransferase [Frankiaceae bacterium]